MESFYSPVAPIKERPVHPSECRNESGSIFMRLVVSVTRDRVETESRLENYWGGRKLVQLAALEDSGAAHSLN